MMGLLGRPVESPWAEAFGEAGASDGADYPSVAELRAAWREVAGSLGEAMAAADEGRLAEPAGGRTGSGA